jgi:hypothetical protein
MPMLATYFSKRHYQGNSLGLGSSFSPLRIRNLYGTALIFHWVCFQNMWFFGLGAVKPPFSTLFKSIASSKQALNQIGSHRLPFEIRIGRYWANTIYQSFRTSKPRVVRSRPGKNKFPSFHFPGTT